MLVVDVSAILPLVFADEDHAYSRAVIRAIATEGGAVPPLFWFEIWNVLAMNEMRRKRIKSEKSDRFVALLEKLQLAVEPLPSSSTLLTFARKHDLTAYDAAYLELASRLLRTMTSYDKCRVQPR